MVNPDLSINVEAMDVSRIGSRVHIPPQSSTNHLAIKVDHMEQHKSGNEQPMRAQSSAPTGTSLP
jgi:hypothetical protein